MTRPQQALSTGIHAKALTPETTGSRLSACHALDPIQAAATAHAIRSFALCGISMYGINQSAEYLGNKTGNELLRNAPPAVAALIIGSAIRNELTNLQVAFEPIPKEDRPSQVMKQSDDQKSIAFDMKDFPSTILP